MLEEPWAQRSLSVRQRVSEKAERRAWASAEFRVLREAADVRTWFEVRLGSESAHLFADALVVLVLCSPPMSDTVVTD